MPIMKTDKVPEFCQSNLVFKNDSKQFEYNSSSYDAVQLETTMKENQNGISTHPNGHVGKADPQSAEKKDKNGYLNTSELEYPVIVDDVTLSNKEEPKDLVAVTTENITLSQDLDLYTDKDVMECDLPELIVCYKDTCHAVKDICVDEGLHSENKFLAESFTDDHTSMPTSEDKHTALTKKAVNNDFDFEEGFRSSSLKECNEDALNGCLSKGELDLDQDTSHDRGAGELESSSESEKHQDSASLCSSENQIKTGEKKCNAAEKTTENDSDSKPLVKQLRKETSLKFLLESSKSGDDDGEQSNQISFGHELSQSPMESTTGEEKKLIHADNLLYNSEVDSGIITFNFDSSKLAVSTKDESPESVIGEPTKSDNKPIHDDGISDHRAAAITNQVKRGEGGESSFSVAGPLSHSGHIPFSGSISLRSDSSTTSTRSFAFPVLQNEWNSSPVRMAKADRRRFRKHRGWSLGMICCRF